MPPLAKHAGIALRQTYPKEGKALRRKAGGYAHARQMQRLKRTLKRQRTILGIVIREVKRKLETTVPDSTLTLTLLQTILETVVDLGYRGVEGDNPGIQIIHRGKPTKLTRQQRRWLRRRQAIEPGIGHLKSDHRMNRCYLPGALGDALNALCSAVGYNLRWLIRAVARLKLAAAFLRLVRSAASLTQWRYSFRPQQMQGLARYHAHALSCIDELPTLRIAS